VEPTIPIGDIKTEEKTQSKTIEEPILMLNHYFKINDHSNLNSSVMVQFGKIGNSNLDYKMPTVQIQLILETASYYSSLYGKDEENIQALHQIMKTLKSRVSF
jgi:hypothetical protein